MAGKPGIDIRQQQRLVAIVMRLRATESWRQRYPEAGRQLRVEQKSGRSQRRIFGNRVKAALNAVHDTLKYAAKISHGNELFGRSVVAFAVPHLKTAQAALEDLRHGIETFGIIKNPVSDGLTDVGRALYTDQRPLARQELMDFFENECNLTNREASVRTARIGNRFKWWTVHEQDHHESANPKRARSITRSVARQRKRR